MILFHERTKQFHLYNDQVSYIMRIMENGQMENLYYGKRLCDKEDFSHFHDTEARSQMTVCVPEPGILSLHFVRQEYPTYGTGDYRLPAFTVLQQNGSRIVNYTYRCYQILSGKMPISPLPATYVERDEEADTLVITMHDDVTDTDMFLTYTIYRAYPVITRNVRFRQNGTQTIVLTRVMSASVEFLDRDYEMVQLSGAWARERYVKTRKLEMGVQAVHGLNGTGSGAEHNPFIALKRPHTTEKQGEVYGFSLVYSGNFLAQVEVSTFDLTRVMLGIHPEGFAWTLRQGEIFQTPEVVMVYSDQGLNGMSQVYHRLYRSRLMRGVWRDKPRPILLNNWEATEFTFDEDRILQIARKAKEVGVELFVLDDGWFGARDDEYRGLGDWQANPGKLPHGIEGLSSRIEEMGLRFGLWVELEMVNKDSDLYRAHPDWVIGAPGRYESQGRHQHVLDFSRREVVDYLFEQIAELIRRASISYIKWDMNRNMSEPYSAVLDASQQGEMMHRYILGVYDLYTRLTEAFPDILFESCASGGNRFDPGMLYFAPQTWTSDDTDANERIKIQYGTSLVYPLVSMGSHVSAVPNQQSNRTIPLETRANAAYFGTFGYEMDLNLLDQEEIEQVKKQVALMKEYRELIQIKGDFYRLISPFEGNDAGWIVVSPDKREAIAAFFQRLNKVNASWLRFKLDGLDPHKAYTVTTDGGDTYSAFGDELMQAGIVISREKLYRKGGDFASVLYVLRQEGGDDIWKK